MDGQRVRMQEETTGCDITYFAAEMAHDFPPQLKDTEGTEEQGNE